MDGVLNFFGSEAGQRRRAALADLSRNIGYYIPPELRGLLGAAAEMTPTSTLERAAQASERMFGPDRTTSQRVGDLGTMLSETAGIVAPAVVASRAAMPAVQAVQEGLLGFSMGAQDVGRAVADRLNQPGQMPTLYSNPLLGPIGAGSGGIRAYHGSPHDFERFSTSAIGTGEGAQAYGHGLYFAEAEDVARNYRDNIGTGVSYKGQPILANIQDGTMINPIAARMSQTGEDAETAIRNLAERYRTQAAIVRRNGETPFPGGDPEKFAAEYEQMADEVLAVNPGDFGVSGRMYEVSIRANPEDFLDWDKPLSEQPQAVLDALNPMIQSRLDALEAAGQRGRLMASERGLPDFTPKSREQLYQEMRGGDIIGASRLGQFDQMAEQVLSEAGVPGIRYLDAGSRGAGDGSRNYVVFNENLIDIVRKYGIAGAAALLGLSVADIEAAMAAPAPDGLLAQEPRQ